MTGRTRAALAGVAVLLLAACGSGSSDDSAGNAPVDPPAATDAPDQTPAPETDDGASAPPESEPAAPSTEASDPEPETPEPEASDAGDEQEAESETDAGDDAGDDTATMVWPDDGCSADNSPTSAASADGPAPTLEIRTESADNQLPDLAVRRINCNGGWVNFKNELPSAQPLLIWMWAPH